MLTAEQKLDFMNFIKEAMENKEEFSSYDIFCSFREEFNIRMSYSSVRDEVRNIVRETVEEVGGYNKEFVNDNGVTYLEYFPHYDEEDFEEDIDNSFEDDECEEYEEYDDSFDKPFSFTMSVDSKNRIFIPVTAARKAQLLCEEEIYVSVSDDEKYIMLKGTYIDNYDKIIKAPCDTGFHVSVKKYFDNTKNLFAIVNPKKHIIVIAKNLEDISEFLD